MTLSRLVSVVIVACSVLLLAPLTAPLLTGRVFVFNDLAWFHLPTRYLYQQALRQGDSVLWTPAIFAGTYIHGEGQIGLFHPFHLLIYRFLHLGPAFNLELIASYMAAFGGTVWLLRRLCFSFPASLFGAMLFAFSGFNLLHHHHLNMVAVVAHMPWLLAAADAAIAGTSRSTRTLATAAMALIMASAILLGFPQGVWWNGVTLAAFATFRAWEVGRWRPLASCVLAVAVGAMLGGLQLLPSFDAAAHSTRQEMETLRDFALTYSLHPFNVIQLWSPYFLQRGAYSPEQTAIFHEFGIYSGAILLVAPIWVWLRREALRARRALTIALTTFAAITFLLALGRYGGLALVLTHIPVLQSFRAPARYIVLTQFALSILAAMALDDVISVSRRQSPAARGLMPVLWVPAALGIATTMAFGSGAIGYAGLAFASLGSAAPGVAVVTAVTALVYLAGRGWRWPIVALVVVTAGDLAAWGVRFVYREPPQTIAKLTRGIPPAPADPSSAYAYVASPDTFSHTNLPVMRGYRLTSGYVALFPATRHPLDSDAARRLSGTRWLFTPDGARQLLHDGVPRVRLLDEQGRAADGFARVTVDRPGSLVASVSAPGRRILGFTERFHEGWSATSDGRPLQTVRVEGDFLGCVVEPGDHVVTLRFMPRSFVYGSVVSAAGVVMLAGLLLAPRRRDGQPPTAAT